MEIRKQVSPLGSKITKISRSRSNSPTVSHRKKKNDWWSRLTVGILLPNDQTIECVNECSTMEDVVSILTKSVTNFVVVKNSQNGNPEGVIHVLDLIDFCCRSLNDWKQPYEFVFHAKEVFQTTAATILLSEYPSTWINSNSLVPEVLRVLSDSSISKIGILEEKVVKAVYTPGDIINFLHENWKEFGDDAKKKVNSCPIKASHHPKVSMVEYVVNSFLPLWHKYKKGGLLSHGNGHLEKFLNLVAQAMIVQLNDEQVSVDMVTVYMEDSLDKVLQFARNREIKRVFVVDKERNPVGELSIGDLIKQFVH